MMKIHAFLEDNLPSVRELISEFEIDEEFSSHDFIEKFIGKFESEYIGMLVKYQNSNQAFQTVNSQIDLYMNTKKEILGIYKTDRKASENVRGRFHGIQWWMKTKLN
ncbi:hypothetical protein FMM05_08600 [Flavobacterium zepuense]|uniref:Uncharacterized protein n=1 Tax=Flavobacterium zepuense TaxID=2593302 RepID=A0A552V4F5_9FLAO|nr:hypothetical protein [Flavobacterium zepuense]TRW25353.1 hypothetical protein FMM05_08600 [Flavobacterium zepuense]